jgi:hypothetical protein
MHGRPYVTAWSGIRIDMTLENNQAVAALVGNITQQVKATAGNLGLVVANSNRVSTKAG